MKRELKKKLLSLVSSIHTKEDVLWKIECKYDEEWDRIYPKKYLKLQSDIESIKQSIKDMATGDGIVKNICNDFYLQNCTFGQLDNVQFWWANTRETRNILVFCTMDEWFDMDKWIWCIDSIQWELQHISAQRYSIRFYPKPR